MKKVLLIIMVFLPFLGFSQFEAGEYVNSDTLKNQGTNLYVDHLKLVGTDLGKFPQHKGNRIEWVDILLDSTVFLDLSSGFSGDTVINAGENYITFDQPYPESSGEIEVVAYVRQQSDNAVIDYVLNEVNRFGFKITVWDDGVFVGYIAYPKTMPGNIDTILKEKFDTYIQTTTIEPNQVDSLTEFINANETDPIYSANSADLLSWKDTSLITIDTSRVRGLQTFVENHSAGGNTTNSIKITYTGIPQSPLMLPLSTNSIAIVSVDSATGQHTYTGINGPVLDNFYYSENSATTGNLITSFSFDDLIGCESSFSFSGLSSCTSFSASKLKYVGGALTIGTMAACTSINLDSLMMIGTSGTTNSFLQLANLTRIYLPKLENIIGTFTISNNPSLTTILLPNLKYSRGGNINLQTNNGNITYIQLGAVGTTKYITGTITISNQKLSQGSVDSLLWIMSSLDGNNGTITYNNTINISGGTSAAPTFTGSTVTKAGSSFVGVTTTCTVSWVGHGYTTGDLLTISGVTTLTNANGTFEITVDSPDQFHYTITSQTATGAGTATVKKAGSTTEGYYYKQLLKVRGATVTTN